MQRPSARADPRHGCNSANLNPFSGTPSKDPFTRLDGREPRASSGPKGKRDVRVPETRRIRDVPFEEPFFGLRGFGASVDVTDAQELSA